MIAKTVGVIYVGKAWILYWVFYWIPSFVL